MYKTLFFDICSSCNAQCAYCQTGIIDMNKRVFKYAKLNEIEKAFDNLLNRGLIDKDETNIGLYNWGEPTLHPQFKEVLRLFKKYTNSRLGISSNFSKRIVFSPKEDDLSHVGNFTISMPGFSQASYDKIHKFNFDTVKKNIVETVKNVRECGFKGTIDINYHFYHFNLTEYNGALDFAIENEIGIWSIFANINDFERCQSYISREMSDAEVSRILKDLLYDSRYEKIVPMSEDCWCPQYDEIVLDTDLNVITCCGDSSVYRKAYDITSAQEVLDWQMELDACKRCKASGMCSMIYIVKPNYECEDNRHIENKTLKALCMSMSDRIIQRITAGKQHAVYSSLFFESNVYKNIAIYGCGTMGKFLYAELRNTGVNVVCFIDNYTCQTAFDGVKIISSEGIRHETIDAIVLTNQPTDYINAGNALKVFTDIPVIKLTDIMYFIERGAEK